MKYIGSKSKIAADIVPILQSYIDENHICLLYTSNVYKRQVYNNRPHSSLRNERGKRSWQTPIEKRAELLEKIRDGGGYKLRLLKRVAA